MEVRHCPKCGSDDVSKSSSSFEYGGSTRWSCGSCGWRYKQGRGIGTGTGNAGTHPRELSGGAQDTLTETGEYCSNCEVVVKGDHACTARQIVEEADGPLDQEEVVERLEEFHYNGERELKDDIRDRNVALTPTFFQVVEWPQNEESRYVNDRPEPEMMDVIREELRTMGGEEEYVNPYELYERLAAEGGVEQAFLGECLSFMELTGSLYRSMDGVQLRED